MSRIAVIGAGFAGLSAAAYLAAEGHQVQVFEKHATAGGRARQRITPEGYVFDMGPSWYWMPDVFERFFADFGSSPAEHYRLSLLDPGFEIVDGPKNSFAVPAEPGRLEQLFESIEPGSAARLDDFLRQAKAKYEAAMGRLIYSPGLSITEFLRFDLLRNAFRLQLLSPLRRHVRRYFRDPRLIALMEFPVLFLGASADRIPALYSLMNYAGLRLGTWYPHGGFGKVVDGMVRTGLNLGVQYVYNAPVRRLKVKEDRVCGLYADGDAIPFDAVVAAADYHHVEHDLLAPEYRNYSPAYWKSRAMAPSCLIFYIGVRKRLDRLRHHTLFFDGDMEGHTREIYIDPKWPSRPQFYVCCPSRTDESVAPPGHENLFLLMPLAPGLEDSGEMREKYFRIMLARLEAHAGEEIGPLIDHRESYGVQDFVEDYHAYRGNAYGLANTVRQTAWLKPRVSNKKLRNLFYCGQLTVPGPGVPATIISGKIAADQVIHYFKNAKYEGAV